MVDFKMWFVKHEKDYLVREIESNTQFKVLPICDDGYDRDLNIVAGCGSIHALNPFSDYHTFIVPHIEYVNE